MDEPTSGVSKDLRRFLVQLAVDPVRLAAFLNDPDQAMNKAGLVAEDQAALSSGDQGAIHARVAEPISPEAVVAAAAGAGNRPPPPPRGPYNGGGWGPPWPANPYAPYFIPPGAWQAMYPWYGKHRFPQAAHWPPRPR